jgi:putative membrane protein
MRRRLVVLAIAALAAFALPAAALAGSGHGSHGKRLSGLDKRFLKELSAGNNFEIALNDLAQRKAANQAIKDLGNHVAADHAANEQKVVALAGRYGVAVPGAPNATQKGVLELLDAIADPAAFEAAWLKAQKAAHEDATLLLEDEIADGRNGRVRAHAEKTLPVVQEHYAMVLSLLGLPAPTMTDPVSEPGGGCHEGSSARAAA